MTVGSANNFDPGLHIKAQNYLDLAATYTVWDRVNLRAGVNNLTDNDPPLVTGGNAGVPGTNLCPAGPCNGNTYPGTWDALGRLLWVGATIDFLPPKPAPAVIPPPPPPPPPPSGDADVPGWVGDPGDRDLPGPAAASASAAAGSRARLSVAASEELGGGPKGPPPFSL